MWYAIIGYDADDSLERRKAAREQHIARLQALQAEGRLLTAGPFPAIDSTEPGEAGFTGSLIIAEFDSLQQAQTWADDEPYSHSGAYQKVTVQPYKQVFPK